MSIRDQVKERINYFKHTEDYIETRRKWRSLIRSLNTAEKNIHNPVKKRRKRRGNTSTGTVES